MIERVGGRAESEGHAMSAVFYLLVADPPHPDDLAIEVGKCSPF
jgi:hypothetical protein